MLLFLHIHVFAVVIITMIVAVLGYITAWKTRNKRIVGLEQKINEIQNNLTQTEIEYENLDEFKKHLEQEKMNLLSEVDSLKKANQVQKKSTEALPSHIKNSEKLERENTIQKKKIQNLHIKMSELSISLKKVKDARNNWQAKYKQLLSDSKPQASANHLINNSTTAFNYSDISSNLENQRLHVLDSIASKAKVLDFERIGQNYSKHDLKAIKGIGVLLEKKLNALNITSFAQIASLEEQDIMTINDILGLPKSKITKGKWIEQAKKLLGVNDKDIVLGKKLNNISSMREYINPAQSDNYKNKEHNLHLINTLTPLDIAKLNALGIYNVEQIVNLSKIDITNVTNILGLLKDRIQNEYWIEQAKDILLSRQNDTVSVSAVTDHSKNTIKTEQSSQEQEVIKR